MQIHILHGSEQLGPFSESEVRSQLAAGTISNTDLVWWDGQPDWIPLAQSQFSTAAAPPAPSSASDPRTFAAASAAPSAPIEQRNSGMAIAAMICGLLVVLVGITFLPAIILGHMALSEIRKNSALKGRGMALTGLIMGYAAPGLCFVWVIVVSILIALGGQVNRVFSTISSTLTTSETSAAGTNDSTPSQPDSSTNAAAEEGSATNTAPVAPTNARDVLATPCLRPHALAES